MFGQMMVQPVLQVAPSADLEESVAALIKVAENPEIVRRIESPNSLLLFLLVRGSGIRGSLRLGPQERHLVLGRFRGRTVRRVQRYPA